MKEPKKSLGQNFLIDKIYHLKERIVDDNFVNFTILEKENVINIFFDIFSGAFLFKNIFLMLNSHNIDSTSNIIATIVSGVPLKSIFTGTTKILFVCENIPPQ